MTKISFITALVVLLFSVPNSSEAATKKNKQCGTTIPDYVRIAPYQCLREYELDGIILQDKEMKEKWYALANGDVTEEKVWSKNGRCFVTYSVRAIVNGNSKNFTTICEYTLD